MNKAHGNRFIPIDCIIWESWNSTFPLKVKGSFQGSIVFEIEQKQVFAPVFISFKNKKVEVFATVDAAKNWAENYI